MMKNVSSVVTIRDLLVLFLFAGVFLLCGGQEESPSNVAVMEREEQEAIYSAIQGFVGKGGMDQIFIPILVDGHQYREFPAISSMGFWYVTAINIGAVYDNSLRCARNAKFSHHLFELSHLNSLSFSNCFSWPRQNRVEIPSSNWENLANSLESLEFRSNPGLIGAIPKGIGCLKKLQSLVLLENGLAGRIPTELGNLACLRRLVLAGNQFGGQIPASFGGLTQLLIFDLSRNNLSGSMPFTLGNLSSLLKLDLSYNKLEGKLPTEIEKLKNVTLFDIRSNQFSGGLIRSIQEMVSLKEMVISNNPIFGGELSGIQWKNLQNLEILDLSNMGLIGKIPECIAELESLRFLGLSDNKLSGNMPQKLAFMPSLRAVYINGNNLTGKLEISEWFYEKMGTRFGAWNNPNLCYKADELTSTSHIPRGVKPC